MATIWTAEELETQISAWKAALLALSSGQEYSIGSRRLRRSDLPEVRSTLLFLQSEKEKLTEEQGSATRRVHTIPVGDTW